MNRKKSVLAFLIVTGLMVTGMVQAEPFNRYYSLQGALADVDGYDSGIAGVATYGIRVPEMHKNFSVETEFSMTFIEPEGQVAGTTYEVSYFTLGAYGVYSHPVSEKLHLRGRFGLLYEDVEVSSAAGGKSDDDFELSFGGGISVGLGAESRFLLEYTVIESDINHISAGLMFKL